MAVPDEILAGIDRLDPLPVTMQRLLECLSGEDLEFGAMVDIVEHDQAVASNILRAANSVLYAGRSRITRLRDAMVRLGKSGLMDVVLGDHIRGLSRGATGDSLGEDDLWLHGAAASLAVRELIRACPEAGIPWEASMAGLVHDIGTLIMMRYLDVDLPAMQELCLEKNLTQSEAETELLGCDHAEVGRMVGQKWSFPAGITEAIALHHQVPLKKPTPLLDAVTTANFVVKTIGLDTGTDARQMKIDQESLSRLGLSWEGFCRMCAATASQVQELKDLYGIRS